MRQLIQELTSGETVLENVPAPQVGPGQVLIQTRRSLVSLGTERTLVEFGQDNWFGKALQQPDKVGQVLDKIGTDGLMPTLEAVFRKLHQPLPLGYCNAGRVLAVGPGVSDLALGDRVASNGPHAEVVCVPRNLVARIPDEVSDEQAAFTVVGAIGLQGIRLLTPTLGETVVVVGLGLIGLLAAQLLRLNGCRVIGIDPDENKLRLARQLGVEVLNSNALDVVQAVTVQTGGVGADGVLITASVRPGRVGSNPAQSDKVMAQAARMSRKRGRIVLVGVVDLTLSRADFYEKELSFQVSCSYGPGRYDAEYEQAGHDYPLPFVRWTENRNFQTVLHLLAGGQLQVEPLITERVALTNYQQIYGQIGTKENSGSIASILTYPQTDSFAESRLLARSVSLCEPTLSPSGGVVGIIGAGNFAGSTLVPTLQKGGATLRVIASANGLSGTLLAKKYGINYSTTDYHELLRDPAIDLCVVATRHDSHARLTVAALQAGKHVFVEKPLVLHEEELADVVRAQQATNRMVLVGFNRRFSPTAQKAKALLGGSESGIVPMNIIATMNAGNVPASSWVHDRAVGGGRILGEACHYVDLITYLTGSRVSAVCLNAMGPYPTETTDSASILLRYENGSTGVINYFANGSKAYAKERIEVYSQGRTLVLDNFKSLKGYGFRGFSSLSGRQDKGHAEQFRQLVHALRTGGPAPIPFSEIINTTQATLAALQSGRENRWVAV